MTSAEKGMGIAELRAAVLADAESLTPSLLAARRFA